MKTKREQIAELSARVAQLEATAGIASECRSRLAARISKLEGGKAEVQDDGKDAAEDAANEALEDFIRDVGRALGAHLSPFAGAVKSVADLVSEHERLNATNAELRRDLAAARHVYTPYYADRDKMHAALFGAGVKGGPGAWRWHSDPQGTTFSDVAAFCRLMLERLDIGDAPEEATGYADLTARLDAARDGLRTAQSCLDRNGEALVVGALGAIERGLARSAPAAAPRDTLTATPEEAAKFRRDHNLDVAPPAPRMLNLNEQIRVTLTPIGVAAVKEHDAKEAAWFARECPSYVYNGTKIDEKGRVTAQAWGILPILAPHLAMGKREPCKMDIEIGPFAEDL